MVGPGVGAWEVLGRGLVYSWGARSQWRAGQRYTFSTYWALTLAWRRMDGWWCVCVCGGGIVYG